MEKEKRLGIIPWISKSEITESMDRTAELIKEIHCPFCNNRVKIPLIARDIDEKIIAHEINKINTILDEVTNFIQKYYGIDIRHAFLLEMIMKIKKQLFEKSKIS